MRWLNTTSILNQWHRQGVLLATMSVLWAAILGCGASVPSPTPMDVTPPPPSESEEFLDCQEYTERTFGVFDDLAREGLAANETVRVLYVRQHDPNMTEDRMEDLAMETFIGLESSWRRMLYLLDTLDDLPAPSSELNVAADALVSAWREPVAGMLQFAMDLKSGVDPDNAVATIEDYEDVQYELMPLLDEFEDLLLECRQDSGAN